MNLSPLGLLFAFAALLFWAVGDFSIQRATRSVGNWKALFFIGALGTVGIFPFVRGDLGLIFGNQRNFLLLFLLSTITLVSALFLFEALKRGKLAIIEPIFGLELLFTVAMSILFGGEKLSLFVYGLSAVVFLGVMLVAAKRLEHLHFHKTLFEKGVIYAGIGSLGMGLINFLTGIGSQTISPLVTIWFTHSFLAIACFSYLLWKGEAMRLVGDVIRYPKEIIVSSVFDNFAWVAYAFSMSLIPISIATTVSESYIALSVLAGIYINHEKVRLHQKLGIALAVVGVIILTAVAG